MTDTTSSVLDIGGEVGALVVYLAEAPPSGELEACPADDPSGRFHTGVHHRRLGGDWAHVALFPSVAAGTYHLLHDDGTPMMSVDVAGGEVRELDLR